MYNRRNLTFLYTYRMFLHYNTRIRSYYAVRDSGLHLNKEGTQKLRFTKGTRGKTERAALSQRAGHSAI